MSRRATFSELRWPDDPFDHDLPIRWASGVATRVLDWTWRAFDLLRAKHLARVDLTQGLEQLERDLTRSHFIEILGLFASETSGFPTFFPVPVPEWPELESRTSPSAKPPANDFAFVSYSNRRWTWPQASGIRMLINFAKTLTLHREGILNYYEYQISTGPLEGTNNKIKTMKRQAYGFRDHAFFKLKILAIHETKLKLVG